AHAVSPDAAQVRTAARRQRRSARGGRLRAHGEMDFRQPAAGRGRAGAVRPVVLPGEPPGPRDAAVRWPQGGPGRDSPAGAQSLGAQGSHRPAGCLGGHAALPRQRLLHRLRHRHRARRHVCEPQGSARDPAEHCRLAEGTLMKALLLVCALLTAPTGAALAADSPWNGTWTLDPGKSHSTGETFTYSKGPGQLLHYSEGSTVAYDFGIDGKGYKAWANCTVTWTAAGKNAWDSVYKIKGKVFSKIRRELSADGKTLTITTAGTRPDGSSYRDVSVFERATGADGLIGTWRSVKAASRGARQFGTLSPAPGERPYDLPAL